MDEDYEASDQPEDAPLTAVTRLDLTDGTTSTVTLERAVETLARAHEMEPDRVRDLLRDGTPLATCFARYELHERRSA